jgi:hypothetical protein
MLTSLALSLSLSFVAAQAATPSPRPAPSPAPTLDKTVKRLPEKPRVPSTSTLQLPPVTSLSSTAWAAQASTVRLSFGHSGNVGREWGHVELVGDGIAYRGVLMLGVQKHRAAAVADAVDVEVPAAVVTALLAVVAQRPAAAAATGPQASIADARPFFSLTALDVDSCSPPGTTPVVCVPGRQAHLEVPPSGARPAPAYVVDDSGPVAVDAAAVDAARVALMAHLAPPALDALWKRAPAPVQPKPKKL